MTEVQPRVLIEDWLPVAELGIESRRESAPIPGQFPKLKTLHIWWARRPLVASAAVVLGGLLPTWSKQLADAFPEAGELQSEAAYRNWLLQLVGIWGDPVAARVRITKATQEGKTLGAAAYGYKPAFKNSPAGDHLDLLHRVVKSTWGDESPIIVGDPTAGGGSIPFVAARLGFPVAANDLNGVAAATLMAGVQIPGKYGLELLPDLKKWGRELVGQIADDLRPFFPYVQDEGRYTYLVANTVNCPRTGRLVPLMPDLWLRKDKGKTVAVEVVTEVDGRSLMEPLFRIKRGSEINFDPSNGTVARGTAISPYDNLVISSDYIKSEARAGRMKQIVYAIHYTSANGKKKDFRAPNPADLLAVTDAEIRLAAVRTDWERAGLLPTEEIPNGLKTSEPLSHGMATWTDFFTPRQLLVHGTFVKCFVDLIPRVMEEMGEERARDVLTLLAMMQAKALNYNARMASWDVGRQKPRTVFDRHDFGFKWTMLEFQGADELYPWCLNQILDAYESIAGLLESTASGAGHEFERRNVTVSKGSAADLPLLASRSVTHICMDPPYYDNVMYAELADFFYVWEKRTLGLVLPEFFNDELSDKENEAVQNPARFTSMGKRKQELATLDYESKMTAIFAECRRTLRDQGVLTVMFTHKRAEAWDTLGMGLLEAGFTIEASWPVNTESQQSLHQANMNSAASTIMLVCRKRPDRAGAGKVFLDDVEGEIRDAARAAVTRFQAAGIDGVDLLLSTYGPTLSVISQHWPVYSSTPDMDGRELLLRPEEALDLAREEVVRLRRLRLVGKASQIDNLTDFVLMAWDIFGAREFPFDTARLLALAVGGLEVDELVRAKVLAKKAGTVSLLPPAERVRRDADSHLPGVRPDAPKFDYMVDAVDTVLYVAEHDGSGAAKRLLDQHGFLNDEGFLATVQGLVNAIPRSKVKGDWVVPEAGLLDMLVTAYLPSVTLPADEPAAGPEAEQGAFDLGQW